MPVVMDTVYFYKFNNYYNRIIKRYDTIAEYTTNGTLLGKQENCNFVHGDGVNSSFTWNKLASDTDTPDYVVVEDYKGIISRWFVTNSFKSRDRQDKLTLRRDLIADYYSDIVEASPCLIRKGWVDNTSPFIFNNEGVRYNKIKKEERLIKDESNVSYIIGFIGNNVNVGGDIVGTIKSNSADYYYNSLADFPYKNYVEGAGNNHTQGATYAKGFYYALRYTVKGYTSNTWYYYNCELTINRTGMVHPSWYTNQYTTGTRINDDLYFDSSLSDADSGFEVNIDNRTSNRELRVITEIADIINNNRDKFKYLEDNVKTAFSLDETTYNSLKEYDGMKVSLGGVVYNVTLKDENPQNTTISSNYLITSQINSDIKPTASQIENILYPFTSVDSTRKNFVSSDIKLMTTKKDYYLEFTEASEDIKTTLPSSTSRTHLRTQPYDMFMLINTDNTPYKVLNTNYVSSHEVNMNMAQAICQAAGSGGYDIQIVPFNPIRGSILDDGTINFMNYESVPIVDSSNNVKGHYVLCSSADLKFTLDKNDLKFVVDNIKKDYNTREYRLCSPNQETVFEFSPAMNEGIDTWEITANYRPYASYIKIQPTWNGLYGEAFYNDLTDFRGLVYNSTLCVTQLSDAWSNYVSNNKNFQQLFDNQINSLTKSQNIQLNAMEETLGLRAYTGMPIGSVLRTIGGSKDIDMQRELNNVALSKMNTDFQYQMDNIKAMPHTVKKLTNINGDTRIFPYIEIYEAREDEIRSFELKMKYTGYTIMTTGYINNYLKPNEETFIQADLIRLDLSRTEETADNHIAVEIASELDKGVYITKEE